LNQPLQNVVNVRGLSDTHRHGHSKLRRGALDLIAPSSSFRRPNQPFNAVNGRGSSETHRPWHSKLRRGRADLSHLEPYRLPPFPTCKIFLACVISGIDLFFTASTARCTHSWERDVSELRSCLSKKVKGSYSSVLSFSSGAFPDRPSLIQMESGGTLGRALQHRLFSDLDLSVLANSTTGLPVNRIRCGIQSGLQALR